MSARPVLPPELIWRIIALVPEDHDLRVCSLVSTNFVDPAQRALFKSVRLGYSESTRLIPILQSSPHIATYINSLSLFKCISGVVELLPLLPQVRHLRLDNYYYEDWTRPMLFGFQEVLLPHITHIEFDNVYIPISIITACTRLLHLSIRASDVGDDADFRLVRLTAPLSSSNSLQVLSLDSIRNSSGRYSSLFTDMIASSRFSSVRCLRIPSTNSIGRYDEDLRVDELPSLLESFQDALKCLDIHYWPIPEQEATDSIFWTPQNPFFIGNFLNLRFLQISMGERAFDENPGTEQVWRLSWLAGMIKDLAKPHPLSILLLQDACEYWPERDAPQEGMRGQLTIAHVQKAWTELDQALHGRFGSNEGELRLPQLKTVAIHFSDGDEVLHLREASPFFKSCLPRCLASEKLVFHDIDIEEFYWSLSLL
ncbi:hypothetical protein DL96DRAFT_394068 [Flagelloscypha sp. PMI_526]|nr:hypothetical protein DL96DRAFT_394068 [Flagelloscypha sp. PMI_526]